MRELPDASAPEPAPEPDSQPEPEPTRAGRLLERSAAGGTGATEELLALVYDELRRLAQGYLARERDDHTLQPTALVHEAWVRLVGQSVTWQGRAHFVGIAAQAMRRILVDHARGKGRAKRGGGWQRVELAGELVEDDAREAREVDLVRLDAALTELAALSERQARVVELRWFGGLSVEEAAAVLDTSPRTVKREWRFARAWLTERLGEGAE